MPPSCYLSESKPEVLDKTCCFFSGCLGVCVLLLALHLAQFLRPHPDKVGSLTTSMSVRHPPAGGGAKHPLPAAVPDPPWPAACQTPPDRRRCQTLPGWRRCKMCSWSLQPGDDSSWTVLTDVISACLFTANRRCRVTRWPDFSSNSQTTVRLHVLCRGSEGVPWRNIVDRIRHRIRQHVSIPQGPSHVLFLDEVQLPPSQHAAQSITTLDIQPKSITALSSDIC